MGSSHDGLMVLQVDYAVCLPFMSQTAKNHATLMRMLLGHESTCFLSGSNVVEWLGSACEAIWKMIIIIISKSKRLELCRCISYFVVSCFLSNVFWDQNGTCPLRSWTLSLCVLKMCISTWRWHLHKAACHFRPVSSKPFDYFCQHLHPSVTCTDISFNKCP